MKNEKLYVLGNNYGLWTMNYELFYYFCIKILVNDRKAHPY